MLTDAISPRSRKRRNPLACEMYKRTYNRWRHLCCDGIWRPTSSIYSVCCGPLDYDYRSQICCADRIVRNCQLEIPHVAGTRAYDSGECLCCGGVIRRKPARNPACCGTRAYDSRERLCCGGVIRRKPARNSACCGIRAYDLGECLCCGGVIWRKPARNSACCGARAYNAQWYICRGDRIQPRTQGEPISRGGKETVEPVWWPVGIEIQGLTKKISF